MTTQPVGTTSRQGGTRRRPALATAVRAFGRPRRSDTSPGTGPETQSGWAQANFDRFIAIRRFSALDGLRALSVIAVVWQHTSGTPGPSFMQKGYLGVDFFFAISGFLITSLLLRERDAVGGISLRKFYARRALRIFPLYYLTLRAYIALVAATRRHSPDGIEFFHHLPAFATYTFNWFSVSSHQETFDFAWSLATEEQFYLLWPPLLVATLMITGGKRIWPPLVVLAVLIAVSQGIGLVADASVLPWRISASLSLPILLGAAAALVLSTGRGFAAATPVVGRVWSAPVAALLLAVAIIANTPMQVIEVLMVVVVVAMCIVEWTPLHPILRWRPLAFVGVISYGVYLVHNLCANVSRVATHEHEGLLLFGVTLVVVVLVAYLSFRFFETPVLKLKRRYETSGEHEGDELSRIAALSRPEQSPDVCRSPASMGHNVR
jgi:peptidoglycan/LPS O-acetylase OafA/YrhL